MNKWKLSSMAMVAAMTAVLSLGGGLSFAAQGDPVKPAEAGKKDKAARQQEHETRTAGSKASSAKPSSAHLAAKREMVRQQQEQRITQDQRKTGAKALQAERQKVYNAKQAFKNSTPQTIESK
jgi:hypothetical protein